MTSDTHSAGPARGVDVGRRVSSGAALLLASKFAIRLVGLLNIVVLARLLSPEDYGVMAIAVVIIGLIQIMSELQVNAALVRLPTLDRSHYDSAFTLALLRGAAMAGLLWLTAGPIAAAMDEPALTAVLRWLALGVVITGFASPRFVDFARRVEFRQEALVAVMAKLASLMVAIAYALYSADYWALVWGNIALTTISVAMTHLYAPYRPALCLKHFRAFFAFGGWLTASGAIGYLTYKMDTFLIGARLGSATVGQFNVGEQISSMATHELAIPFTNTIYTGLSQFAEDRERLINAYLKAQATMLGVILPIGFGTALVANELVALLAGPQWDQAAMVVRFVAPAIAVSMLVSGAHALLMVKGETRALFWRNVFIFAMRTPILLIALYQFGLMGVLYAKIASTAIFVFATLHLVRHLTGNPIMAPLVAARRSFAATICMTAAVLAAAYGFPEAGEGIVDNAVMLLAKTALGATVYASVHYALWRLSGRPDSFETIVERMARQGAQRLMARVRPARAL